MAKNYQDRKEYFKQLYQKKKIEPQEKSQKYTAESIKILLSFKDYLSLNREGAVYFEKFRHALVKVANEPKILQNVISLLHESSRLSRAYWKYSKSQEGKAKATKNQNLSERQREKIKEAYYQEEDEIRNRIIGNKEDKDDEE